MMTKFSIVPRKFGENSPILEKQRVREQGEAYLLNRKIATWLTTFRFFK